MTGRHVGQHLFSLHKSSFVKIDAYGSWGLKIFTSLRYQDFQVKPYPCLLIFHDNRPTTYQHLDEIVTNLLQQGYRLVHFDPKRL